MTQIFDPPKSSKYLENEICIYIMPDIRKGKKGA